MKMFKRFAAALLAGVMVLAMLTACGGSGSGSPIAPGSDVEKAEAFYMDVYNAMLEAEYQNDTTLKAEAKKLLEDSLDDNGALKSGKKMTVTQESDNPFVQTAITILPADANGSTPPWFYQRAVDSGNGAKGCCNCRTQRSGWQQHGND